MTAEAMTPARRVVFRGMPADQSFQDLGRRDDPRRVELVNEFYRPTGAAARAIRIETPEAARFSSA